MPPTVGLGSVSAGTPLISPISGPAMEIAHILFVDIVGYSKLRTMQQADVQRELQHQLQSSGEVTQGRSEGKLIIRPTGDGAALIFLRDILSPLRCAIQVQTLLRHNEAEIRSRTGTPIYLRMGIHSGPIIVSTDLNSQSEVAGEGVNIAQRVMDCGDAGHILLSAEYAEKLRSVDPWPRYLQNIGECQVKHGVTVELYNFYGKFDGIPCGQPGKPQRVLDMEKNRSQAQKQRNRARISPQLRPWIIAGCLGLCALGGGYGLWTSNPEVRNTLTKTYRQWTMPPAVAAKESNKDSKKTEKRTASNRTSPRKRTGSQQNESRREPQAIEASVAPVIETTAAEEGSIVPTFLGLSFEEATQLAKDSGLRLVRSVNSTYNTDYPEGQVYQQSDASGKRVKRGSSIYVCVSKGEQLDPGPSEGTEQSKDDSAGAKNPE